MVKLTEIYAIFCKMGLFTFGGGYAMLPILKSEVVDKRKWISEEELLNYYSIGQCTPGIIAVNASSFIGYKLRGISGMLCATAAVITPSLIIIIAIAAMLQKYMDNQYLQWAFGGIRVSVVALIICTVIDLWRKGVKNKRDYLVFFGAATLLWLFNLSAISVVVLAAAGALIPNFGGKKS